MAIRRVGLLNTPKSCVSGFTTWMPLKQAGFLPEIEEIPLVFDLLQESGVNVQSKDRWGRYTVFVCTIDCLDVAAEMMRAGLVWHFKRYDNSRHYSNLEKEARTNRVCLWEDRAQVPPWEFRKNR